MSIVKRHVSIPANRRLRVDVIVPTSVPTGEADIEIVITPVLKPTTVPFEFPVDHLGQWPEALPLSRDDLYGDTEN